MNRWFFSAVFLSLIAPEAATFALFGLTVSATAVVAVQWLLQLEEEAEPWATQSIS